MARAATGSPPVEKVRTTNGSPGRAEGPVAYTDRGPVFTGNGVPGLTFERRWTKPGAHPYDEITWESRSATIANEKGETVFEQADVEVPSFWSQLATNVVVS